MLAARKADVGAHCSEWQLRAHSVEKLTASLERVVLAEYFSSKAPFRKQLFPIGL
jgi:hypothetical protein